MVTEVLRFDLGENIVQMFSDLTEGGAAGLQRRVGSYYVRPL